MDTSLVRVKKRRGIAYFDRYLDHPLMRTVRGKSTMRLHPDIVSEVCEDLPHLKDKLDYPYFKRWSERRGEVNRIKTATNFDFDYQFKLPPYKHQQRAISFILNTPAQALFAEPGTGKTYCALVSAEMRLMQGKCEKVLVISPASVLRSGWYKDLKKFTDLKGIVVHRDKWRWFCPECGTRKYHYDKAKKHMLKCGVEGEPDEELLWNQWDKAPEILENATDYNVYITSIDLVHLYLNDFLLAGFDYVILDESTMIKNPAGKQAKSVIELGHDAKYRLAMTGTPITNELEDIWTQMQFVDMSFQDTIGRFRSKYYWQHPVHHYIKNPKDGAAEEVTSIIQDSVLRIKKQDCLDLPPRTRAIRQVEPSKETRRVYNDFLRDLYARHKGEEVIAFNTFTEILRLHQIINGFWTYPGEPEVHIVEKNPPKIKEVKSIIESTDRKVIIWIFYRHDARILEESLADYNPAVVNGKTKYVEGEVEKFLEDDTCRVMIAHPKSARYGHTWVVADTTVYYTFGYGVEDYWQSRDRNYRIGQEHSVHEIFLSSGGIEDKILASIMKKEDFSKSVMENFEVMIKQMKL